MFSEKELLFFFTLHSCCTPRRLKFNVAVLRASRDRKFRKCATGKWRPAQISAEIRQFGATHHAAILLLVRTQS